MARKAALASKFVAGQGRGKAAGSSSPKFVSSAGRKSIKAPTSASTVARSHGTGVMPAGANTMAASGQKGRVGKPTALNASAITGKGKKAAHGRQHAEKLTSGRSSAVGSRGGMRATRTAPVSQTQGTAFMGVQS